MRAVYTKELDLNINEFELNSEKAHHLLNVLRIKNNEKVLLLNGNGLCATSNVNIISKRKVKLENIEFNKVEEKKDFFELALAQTKKEALDLSLKQAVEIGIRKIYILKTIYSQDYEIRSDRLEKVLSSALEQSNALYLPEIEFVTLEDFLKKDIKNIIYFSSVKGEVEPKSIIKGNTCILIGPEAGLSKEEELLVKEMTNTDVINLPTNIMRAPTATSFCLGYIMGKID